LRSISTGFLHNHPRLEYELGLDSEHVIVDKKDWEKALFAMQERLGKALTMVAELFPQLEEEDNDTSM